MVGAAQDGIVVGFGSNDNVVQRNTISRVAADDDLTTPGQVAGIEVGGVSSRNAIAGNTLLNNEAPGVQLGEKTPPRRAGDVGSAA